ncbi:disulfide bond formation protein B [Altererythrobacter arenosus]|uniref:Disulfide bond formation protein B n=1 Tax=Altererythrobacter arenosus TaxID=3032592 RepID=A0ABY8FWU7_9SPHN|nr:disulfide bond formation protein B [Altererythrobacter sp. CAU 1644]WFL78700.1 disulfide bond formation protein B [Altererythrobacter sp. CAU 1644]
MTLTPSARLTQKIALGTPALLIAGAYISEYGFGLFPCEMCWWQRYPHFAAIALGLLSYAIEPKRLLIALAALAVLASGLIGGFHAGVEYGWWEGLTSCTSAVDASGDPMAAILNAPMVRCDAPQWTLMGISLAGFNFLISSASAIAALYLLVRRDRT